MIIETPYYRTTSGKSPIDIGQLQDFEYTPYQIYALKTRLLDFLADNYPEINVVVSFRSVLKNHLMKLYVYFTTEGKETKFSQSQSKSLTEFVKFVTGEEPYISLLYRPYKIISRNLIIPIRYSRMIIPYLKLDYSIRPFYRGGKILVDASNIINYVEVLSDMILDIKRKIVSFYRLGAISYINGPMIKQWNLKRIDKIYENSSMILKEVNTLNTLSDIGEVIGETNTLSRIQFLAKPTRIGGVDTDVTDEPVTTSTTEIIQGEIIQGREVGVIPLDSEISVVSDGLYVPTWKDERITCYYQGLVNFLQSRIDGDKKLHLYVGSNNVTRHWVSKSMIKLTNNFYFDGNYFVVTVMNLDESRKISSMIDDIRSLSEGKVVVAISTRPSWIGYYTSAANSINPKYECISYRINDPDFPLAFSCFLGSYNNPSTKKLSTRETREKIWKKALNLITREQEKLNIDLSDLSPHDTMEKVLQNL